MVDEVHCDMVAGGCMRHMIWLSWIEQLVEGLLCSEHVWRGGRVVPCKAGVSSFVWVPDFASTHMPMHGYYYWSVVWNPLF